MNWPAPEAPPKPAWQQSVRRYWWLPVVAIGVGVVGLVAGADPLAEDDDLSDNLTSLVNRLERQQDCDELQAIFDRRNDADEMRYIDDALWSAGCYDD